MYIFNEIVFSILKINLLSIISIKTHATSITDFIMTNHRMARISRMSHLLPNLRLFKYTLGGIASICFKFHFQTDYQQTLRIQIQGSQGCQKIRKIVRNPKLLIARSTIQSKKCHFGKPNDIGPKFMVWFLFFILIGFHE